MENRLQCKIHKSIFIVRKPDPVDNGKILSTKFLKNRTKGYLFFLISCAN